MMKCIVISTNKITSHKTGRAFPAMLVIIDSITQILVLHCVCLMGIMALSNLRNSYSYRVYNTSFLPVTAYVYWPGYTVPTSVICSVFLYSLTISSVKNNKFRIEASRKLGWRKIMQCSTETEVLSFASEFQRKCAPNVYKLKHICLLMCYQL